MNYAAKWNKIDSIIFFCENKFKEFKRAIEDSNAEEPDVELMIAAETEYLRKENEDLKKREMPLYLIEEGANVLCPKCNTQLQDTNVKYCSNCGHRVIRHISINSSKGTVYNG